MLQGLQVLDASSRLGWLAGRLLADMGAEVVKLEAPGSDLSGAEWRALNVNKRLLQVDLDAADAASVLDGLLEGVDILVATPQTDAQRALFDGQRLTVRHPRLIAVLITPFGLQGPKALWQASDLEIMAAGGAMSLAGNPDGAPMRVSAPQSYAWVGGAAAVGATLALAARAHSGRGQCVDVSAQAAVITALAHAPTFVDIAGITPKRAGAFITGRSVSGAKYRVFWPCRDGFINFILYGGAAGRRTNEQLVDWMRSRGAELGPLAAIDWSRFDPTRADQAQVDAMEAPIASFLAGMSKREFLEGAHKREMLGYPVSTVRDIADDAQLQARAFWQDLTGLDGRRERHCGAFVVVDGQRASLRCAPGTPAQPVRVPAPAVDAGVPSAPASAPRQALEGLKVVEFGGYAAGPHIGKMLANFGATVVHVESMARPDGFRLQYPPYKDGKPGVDAGGCFAFFNDSKLGVTLDLKNEQGLQLARQLVDWCDVVVENMRPGVLDRLGLGYARVSASHPELIMLSTCNMGQTGPRADTPGFGSQLTALAGMCGLTGEADGPPMLLYGPYIDFIASTLGAAALGAALEQRRRSGRGCQLDVSQYECGLMFIAGPLLAYHDKGTVAERCGNDDPQASPHGVWPCAGGGWLALSCWSTDEFGRLCAAIGQTALAAEPALADVAGRRREAARIAAVVGSWAARRNAEAAAEALQRAGVHAHAVATMADLFEDAQLKSRQLWRRRPHAVIGDQAYAFPAFDLTRNPGEITRAAPRLGEHNRQVFVDLLGLDPAAFDALHGQGAFD